MRLPAPSRSRVMTVAALAVVTTLGLAGCSGGGSGSDSSDTLTVWTIEDVQERVDAQQKIVDAYTAATGTKVDLVPIAEDQLATVLASSAAADELPDVIGAASLGAVSQMYADDLLDSEIASSVVDALGADTFSTAALDLTQVDGAQISVPSDGFAQLLYYRTDLFAAAGLEAPTTYDAIEKAAAALDSGDVAGIVAATAPGDSFTQQTFEQLALANGCQLTEDKKIALDSDACVNTFDFYSKLITEHSVAGNQDADTTRASYFAGQAAMTIWSSFLLDELAGLRNDALPTCAECTDTSFLAKNTGVVAALEGPDGSGPASWGEVVSWAPLQGADAKTSDFIEYMMGDGYVDWLSVAPEGKVPTRTGTAENATEYTDAWKGLEVGVDTKATLASVYGDDILDTVAASTENIDRWGYADGEGVLAGSVAGQFIVPKALSDVINSGTSPADAAKQAAEEATQIQSETE